MIYQTENFGKKYNYRSLTHQNYTVGPHIHEFSEFALSIKGETKVKLNGKLFVLKENELILILPNQVHEYLKGNTSYMRCAVFSNDFTPTFFLTTNKKKLENQIIDLSNDKYLLNKIDNLDPNQLTEVSAVLNLICDKILKNSKIIDTTEQNKTIYFEAIDYVAKNFKEDITLNGLAKKLGYHEKYLSSSLHNLTGMNFRSFLHAYRINFAIDLLHENIGNKLRISDICMASGFSSINTFNRAFLAFTGKTPSDYQRELLTKNGAK